MLQTSNIEEEEDNNQYFKTSYPSNFLNGRASNYSLTHLNPINWRHNHPQKEDNTKTKESSLVKLKIIFKNESIL